MAMTISFTYDGTDYVLEYNRNAIRVLDTKYDFSLNELEKMQVSKLPDMFACAFLMHHSEVKRNVIDEMWDAMEEKGDLVGALGEMYMEAVNSIISEEPKKGKAISWTKGK